MNARKISSLLLALVMLFTMIPSIAVAAEPTDYSSAVVKEVTANSGSVSFGAVNASLGEHDEGFTISGDNLVFDTTGKTAGSYYAVVGGQVYTAVIFNAVGGVTAKREFPIVNSATIIDESLLVPSAASDGFYVWSKGSPFGHQHQNAMMNQYFSGVTATNKFEPFYVYKVQGGAVVSMTEKETVTLVGADYLECDEVTIGGKKLYKFTPVIPANTRILSGGGSAVIMNDGAYVDQFDLILSATNTGDTWSNHGLCGDEEAIAENRSSAVQVNQISASTTDGLIGPNTLYFVKQVGTLPDNSDVEYVLFDEVDVATLTAATDDPSVANVTDFVVESKDGKNVIGFTVEYVNTDVEAFCEVKVSFKDKNGNPYNWYVTVSSTPPVSVGGSTIEVSNVAEFTVAYNDVMNCMNGATILLKSGTYPMDLYVDDQHSKIRILPADGATVVLTGDPNSTNDAIVTFDVGGIPQQVEGFVIDGNEHDANNPRDGVYNKKSSMPCVGRFTIRDCDVAISGSREAAGMSMLTDNTIENCRVGIEIFSASNSRVQGNTVKNCNIAILYKSFANNAAIKLNKLSGNNVDFATESSDKAAYLSQNYFGHMVDNTEKGIAPILSTDNTTASNDKIYFAPYYTKSDFSALGAVVGGAETKNGALEIPVDLTLGAEATTFETDFFSDMKGANGDAAVSIPVNEVAGEFEGRPISKVTTIWGFEKDTIDATQSKETMDLKVTDELSDTAKLIVNNNVESGAVQYVNFEHDGDLPGTATVKVLKTGENSDPQNLKLYYINEETGEVEEADIVSVTEETIGDDTYYVITVTHCSEYIISTGLTFKQETDEGEEDESITAPSGSAGSTDRTNPNTSVKSGVSLMPAAAIVVIAAAAYILNKKRA